MSIEAIKPENMSPPLGAYSYATKANGFVFVSGLLPIAADGRKLTDEPFEVQTKQVLANLADILRASGSEPGNLAHVRIYLKDIENWAAFNTIYKDWIGIARPARCVVPVATLHYGFEIEIEAVATATSATAG